jgi:hypothetical protein
MEKKTNIYVFDFGNQIKIGQSGNVKRRLRNIETQSGREAVQTFSIEADSRYENIAHKLLSEYRGVGEYFNVPFNFAVSILKSLVNYNFIKEIKPNSQLFLPLQSKYNIVSMEGLTHEEIGKILGISPAAAKQRLLVAGIKPKAQTGRMNFYDKSVVDLIRVVSKGGRPKKKK